MRALAGTAVLALALLAAGCGSDEEGNPIPPADAAQIQAQLDNIEGQIENGSVGACNDIKGGEEPTFDALEAAVERVPESVDTDVRDALDQSVDRLGALVDEECAELEAEEPEPEPTETITIETVPEETVPEETVPEETVPEEEGEGKGNEERTGEEDKTGQEGGPPEGGVEPGTGGGSGGVPAPGGDE